MKIEFEDGSINSKVLFLKAEKVSEFLIFKSKLFYSRAVDGEKELYVWSMWWHLFHLQKSLAEHKMRAFSETIGRSQKPRGESIIYDY